MNEIQRLITDIVEASGLIVEDIKMSETGGTIKVVCDTEKGISSSELVSISKKILRNEEFDEKYAVNYRLEVSSPGIDTPLTKARHFAKNKGRDIELQHEFEGQKSPIRGIIEDVDDEVLSLNVKIKKENTTIRIPIEKVISAVVRLKW
jgi:ribosome maturation factor RimP